MQDQTGQKRSQISKQFNHYGLTRNIIRNTWAIFKIIQHNDFRLTVSKIKQKYPKMGLNKLRTNLLYLLY